MMGANNTIEGYKDITVFVDLEVSYYQRSGFSFCASFFVPFPSWYSSTEIFYREGETEGRVGD